MTSFRTFWLAIKDLFDELFILAFVNVLWVLISAPLVVAAGLLIGGGAPVPGVLVALLAVGPMAPATAGLYLLAQRVNEGRAISWRMFFQGFREYLVLSWKVYGLWTIGFITIGVNLQFYSQLGSNAGTILFVLFLYILLIWFALLIYIGPLMMLQTDKRIRLIARNAFLMVFGRPIFTLLTLVLMGVILLLSYILPILLLVLTFAFLAVWSFRATTTLIAEAEARRAAMEEKAAAAASRESTEKGRRGQVRPRD